MREDVGGAAGQLGAVVGPDPLPPVAVAACLGREQMEQGLAVAGVVGGDAGARTRSWNSELACSIGINTCS